MNPRNALNLLKQSADKFLGTLEDHVNLEAAVEELDKLVREAEAAVAGTPATPAEPAEPAAPAEAETTETPEVAPTA